MDYWKCKKQQVYKPDSVPLEDSIIYLTQPTLQLGRAALKRRFTWSCNLQVAHQCESLRIMVVSYTTFSPLPYFYGGYFLLPYHTLTHICSFNSTMLFVVRTFLSLTRAIERPTARQMY